MAKQHVILVHGGSCWATYTEYLQDLKSTKFAPDFSPQVGWQQRLQKNLGSRFIVFPLEMPNWQNAKYLEWKIWFEKAVAAAGNNPLAVGHSLGAIFLAKYFSETPRPPKIKALLLVSAPYQTHAANPDFGDFALKAPPRRLQHFGPTIYFYQSQDDPIVTPKNLIPYRKLLPEATIRLFKTRGHFHQPTFPELVRDLKSLA
jgi:predicted alpha/beta hydrolase family esterase